MIELKGKPVADDIKEKAIKRVEELRSQGIIPKIATIRVGDDPGVSLTNTGSAAGQKKWGSISSKRFLQGIFRRSGFLQRSQHTTKTRISTAS